MYIHIYKFQECHKLSAGLFTTVPSLAVLENETGELADLLRWSSSAVANTTRAWSHTSAAAHIHIQFAKSFIIITQCEQCRLYYIAAVYV